jgi:hypothetical protein
VVVVITAALAVAACGKAADPVPTDDELRRFTKKLERDAKLETKAAASEARRDETDRAAAAVTRREDSARERGKGPVQ